MTDDPIVELYELGPDIDLDREVVLDRDGTRITEQRASEIAMEELADRAQRALIRSVTAMQQRVLNVIRAGDPDDPTWTDLDVR